MMLRLQRYDLEVEYEPGKNLLIANTLSRAPEESTETWPGINQHIADMVSISAIPVTCIEIPKQKNHLRAMNYCPERPWRKIAVDFFELEKQE